MKKILSFLMLTMFAVGAWAADVTFTPGTVSGSTTDTSADQMTSGGITFSSTSAALGRTDNYRFYASSTTTVTSTVGNITKIVFTCNTNSDYASILANATFSAGSVSASENVVTWTGDAASFTFKPSAQVRVDLIVVTYTSGTAPAVAAPVISGTTPFLSSTEVSITCDTQGASIYYTIDGTDPTNQSTPYTAPFELTESATVKAIAYDATGNASQVASKSFEKIATINTIAEVNALPKDATFVFGGNAVAIVQYHSGNGDALNNLYIQDETGGTLIYGNNIGQQYAEGAVIPAGWGGKVSTYNDCPEVVSPTGFTAATSTVELVAKELKTNAADLSVDFARYMVVKNATLVVDNDSTFMTTEDGTLKAFTKTLGIRADNLDLTKTYNVYGVLGAFYGTAQLLPMRFEEYVAPLEKTNAPVITYEEREDDVVVTALGDGEVKLYADGIEVENPYVVERTYEEQVIVFSATAQENGKEISDEVIITIVVNALEPEPVEQGYYLVGTFCNPAWSQSEGEGRIEFVKEGDTYVATDVVLEAGDEFKIITPAEDGGWIWYGGEHADTDYFLVQPGFYNYGTEITLVPNDPEGKGNFKMEYGPATYKITIKNPSDPTTGDGIAPKALQEPIVMVMEKTTGIDAINTNNVKSVRYYNLQGVESATPFQGVNIVVREMTDGSKVASKIVK